MLPVFPVFCLSTLEQRWWFAKATEKPELQKLTYQFECKQYTY